jgi:hypothetical protein
MLETAKTEFGDCEMFPPEFSSTTVRQGQALDGRCSLGHDRDIGSIEESRRASKETVVAVVHPVRPRRVSKATVIEKRFELQ